MLRLLPIATLIVLALGATLTGAGHAQYPSPEGSATLSATNPAPPIDSNTTLIADIRDSAGNPVPGVNVVYDLVGDSGDAALGSKTITKVTDANGRALANLYTGTTPRVLVIEIRAGVLTSRVLVNVVGSASPRPPAAPLLPPATGNGGLAAQ
jgi:hypothetical protein